MVEGGLHGLPRASPSAAPSPAAPPPAPAALGVAVPGRGLLLRLLLRLGFLILGVGLLLERRPLDLRLDLVAQLEIPGVLVLGR